MDATLREIKKSIVRMAHYSRASHVGSALSVADMLYVLYSRVARIRPDNVAAPRRDRVLLSKGHASTALYATLAHLGLMDKALLDYYYTDGAKLPGHLDRASSPAVDISAGSLGHGLSIGLGMALADSEHHIYVLMGDGECNEGSVWEAAMLLGKLKLRNLTVLVDRNNLQAFGTTQEVMGDENLGERFQAFGLDVQDIDGHDTEQIESALSKKSDRARAIICHTIKGHGVSFMEGELLWHYRSPDERQLALALEELGR